MPWLRLAVTEQAADWDVSVEVTVTQEMVAPEGQDLLETAEARLWLVRATLG